MYTASFLSILALLATTTLSAPIAQPDAVVYKTDNVVVVVTVTAGQEPATPPAAISSPAASPVQVQNGKLQIAAAPVATTPAPVPTTTTTPAAPSSTSSSIAGGIFQQAKPSSNSASSNAGPSGMNIQSTNGDAITIYVKNNWNQDVDYVHNANPGSTPIEGSSSTGTIAQGATYSYTVQKEYAGNVGFANKGAGGATTGTLIEGSWVNQNAADGTYYGGYKFDLDVSNVEGFSVPMTCEYAATNTHIGGCAVDLWSQSTPCPSKQGGTCKNLVGGLLTTTQISQVDPWFQPCAKAGAYLFWKDDAKGNGGGNGHQEGTISCTIGTS